ncbi:MAG: 50S ribosomal protein L9 [Chitinophagales bacterium]|nr:50S ribosomal protein L9 [Bacteroidota bacterium]MCB9042551.1 50S ribosomal protein L9 [Chitinophagales bacterium]
MEIILLQDIENLGEQYQTVKVKPGYGRNYLIPKKLAIIANRTNRNQMDVLVKQNEAKKAKEFDEVQKIADKISAASISVGAKVGTSGKIFGSVTNVQLSEAIKKATGVDIDRRKIAITDEIKSLGTYNAVVDLHRNLKLDLSFEVVAE